MIREVFAKEIRHNRHSALIGDFEWSTICDIRTDGLFLKDVEIFIAPWVLVKRTEGSLTTKEEVEAYIKKVLEEEFKVAGKIKLEYDEADIRELVRRDIESKMNVSISQDDIKIEVQSKQNYRVHEWESGKFRATYEARK